MLTGFIVALFALAGGLCWTFAEYALHNWLGHVPKGKNGFSKLHLQHHSDTRFYAPTRIKALSAVAVMLALTPLAALAVGWLYGAGFATGFVTGYIGYEVLHRRTHTHPPRGPYGRWARKNHLYHHFGRPHANHGVSTPIWDMVFGTHVKPGVVRVPRKHAMDWLTDPETGEVREEHRADYVLVGRAPRASRETSQRSVVARSGASAQQLEGVA